jgi:hypothetical protein
VDPHEARVATIFIIAAFGTMCTLGWLWLGRRKDQLPQGRQSRDQDERLERIEQAIEAVAIEVERISEGQRFTTRLLADRQATSSESGELTNRR